ncbi:MAG: D-cysteine desulfhydrase family protein [bacterium]|nr:D-cysteine desulfhydrase family protein [bacterium]
MRYTRRNTEAVRETELELLVEIEGSCCPGRAGDLLGKIDKRSADLINGDRAIQRKVRAMLTTLEELGAGVAYGVLALDVVDSIAGDQVISFFRRWENFIYARQVGLSGLENANERNRPTPADSNAFDQLTWLACLIKRYRELRGQRTVAFDGPPWGVNWIDTNSRYQPIPWNRCFHPSYSKGWLFGRDPGTMAAIAIDSKDATAFGKAAEDYYAQYQRDYETPATETDPVRQLLKGMPRKRIGHLPTPLEKAERLSSETSVSVFIKRDDCTGLAIGGNKVRKLEFVVGEALQESADTLITSGGAQSNHVRQTGAVAALLGLKCHVVTSVCADDQSERFEDSGNVLLDQLLGVQITSVPAKDVDSTIQDVAKSSRQSGGRPHIIPVGASDAVGSLGYVNCAAELIQQFNSQGITPSHVFLPTGSGGTQAGLVAGFEILGVAVQVVGIAVSSTAEAKTAIVRGLIGEIASKLETEIALPDSRILVLDDWVGDGYGVRSPECEKAIRKCAQLEGLLLDPVYTGKAMAGMLACLADQRFEGIQDPVFLHTGGSPALFAYDW